MQQLLAPSKDVDLSFVAVQVHIRQHNPKQRYLSMVQTRTTYQGLSPPRLPRMFWEAQKTGPRLPPRSELWESKARPLWTLYLALLS